jgi:uncharacterized protein (UPF0332 family)
MPTKKSKKPVSKGLAMTLLAAAAGAYMLYGSKDATKNRKAVKGWMLKAKGEILEKLEQTKDINEEKYHKIVDSATKKYGPLAKVGKEELEQLIKETKGHWKNIKKHIPNS